MGKSSRIGLAIFIILMMASGSLIAQTTDTYFKDAGGQYTPGHRCGTHTPTMMEAQRVEQELKSWLASAYQNRPELQVLDKEIERMELNLSLRRNDILPKLDVSGRYQRDVTFTKGSAWRAGLDFSLPFGNVGARSLMSQAESQMAQLQRQVVREKRGIELEVRAIEIQLREGLRRLKTLALGVEQAREKREIAIGRFENGLANNFDITDADRALVNAETALLGGLVEYASNLAELEARIGRQL